MRQSVRGSALGIFVRAKEYCCGGYLEIEIHSVDSFRSDIRKEHRVKIKGQDCKGVTMFGVLFPNRSFPLDFTTFLQVDDHRWLLDMNYFVGEAYDQVKDICVFLINERILPADKALAVYVQSPGSGFEYRGAVHNACPSAVIPLLWPANPSQMLLMPAGSAPLTAQIGVSVEDVATLPLLNLGQQKRVEELAMKVGENLFNYMQSFCTVEGEKLVVPMDILNRWFKKFQEKAKLDPEYLNRFTL